MSEEEKSEIDRILALPVFELDAELWRKLECSEPTGPGLWLRLYHGRENPDCDMSDWGEDGAWFGPFKWSSNTYQCNMRFGLLLEDKDSCEEVSIGSPVIVYHGDVVKEMRQSLFVWEDLIYHDGMFYGDMSLDYIPESQFSK